MKYFIIVVLILLLLFSMCRVVPQNNEGLIETLGKYSRTVKAGLVIIIPVIQRLRKVSLAMFPAEISKYSIITKDNAEITTSLTLNYLVTDSYKYFYNNTDSVKSMVELIRGHLRDIIGRMDLNDALGSTSSINSQLSDAIGDLTDIYGIRVVRVNIDELLPSTEIQKAMDKQLTADREKIAAIEKAEGEAKNIELTTKAKNDALIATAKAKAEAVKTEADAEAYRIDQLQASLAKASDGYFKNQSLDSFNNLAKGPNNLIVVNKDDLTSLGTIPAMAKVWHEATKDSE
ncbi:SPFH/Band 7/PHB domain protein [Lactobacillus kullabergensis]|uniref:SPFH domain-containing protein n=1 Tax=Lactobacillus TaxID=1578 RepID=UPI0018DBC32D|nr:MULTISPECIES: SPFH domain-containing protein [Lactobacillus]MBI0120490.1 SPFH/Band 7/PHB domain protein [Lactobacillus sp. M0398]MBI0122638.1 SPFH/Band 7/PHB domain protein [Lactobacillus sp. W8174]MBI0134298.1 SPFH/Band 7/PHB domain protein [Lactobacillus sp. W8173]MCX0290710.1 SPFH/Band 7/PHB domain protein [Lactobacillus kullabergensis]